LISGRQNGGVKVHQHLQPDELGGRRVPHFVSNLSRRQSLPSNDERKVRQRMQNLRKTLHRIQVSHLKFIPIVLKKLLEKAQINVNIYFRPQFGRIVELFKSIFFISNI
jgi:hypothetical protein